MLERGVPAAASSWGSWELVGLTAVQFEAKASEEAPIVLREGPRVPPIGDQGNPASFPSLDRVGREWVEKDPALLDRS